MYLYRKLVYEKIRKKIRKYLYRKLVYKKIGNQMFH